MIIKRSLFSHSLLKNPLFVTDQLQSSFSRIQVIETMKKSHYNLVSVLNAFVKTLERGKIGFALLSTKN